MNEIQVANIENKIYFIRNQRVMLDSDLAEFYGVETRRLNEQVRRNIERFPDDFMFQLTQDEYDSLRSQFATLKKGRGKHPKYLPLAFTENGLGMLSGVLKSKKAIQVHIQIIRAFTMFKTLINYVSYDEFKKTISALLAKTDKNEELIHQLYAKMDIEVDRIDQILNQFLKPKKDKKIGFHPDPEEKEN